MIPQLRRLLKFHWGPGGLIPPEARADASQLPEDVFPVYCPRCRYDLRTLPDGPCPECGRPFDRGRLLVEQYVIGAVDPECRPVHNRAIIAFILGFALLGIGSFMADIEARYRVSNV